MESRGGPDCSQYARVITSIDALLTHERAAIDLHRYLLHWDGGQFDLQIDHNAANAFTEQDFRAVRRLRVGVLRTAQKWLLDEGREEVQGLLRCIPSDLDIWMVEPDDFGALLGPDSSAWRLWQLLFDKMKGARTSGRGVTAGKLLHGKRPRLIPIFDRARIGRVLKVTQADIWEAIWCVMRTSQIRSRLGEIRQNVTEARDLSLLRVLDIIVWMSLEPEAGS